ncbi:helix-turn-helix domain-containing protein [Patescibacteria group bacterium]|jgi:YesN/AraC family two-component response regulator|nr:helix-turn-helix domain-containing protein [Patescibacteria group bacterium]
MRILKACEILAHTDKKVIEVALDVGYQNITFFNRMFKKIMGITPHSYRLSKMKIQKVS